MFRMLDDYKSANADLYDDIQKVYDTCELLQSIKLRQNESFYYPLKRVCLNLGIKEEDFDLFMDYEIMTDYLLSNTDRHMNNISVMRNPDTLEILGFAPIYDSGNSMFYNVPYEQLDHVKLNEIKGVSGRKGHLENREILKTATCAERFRQVTVFIYGSYYNRYSYSTAAWHPPNSAHPSAPQALTAHTP